MVEIQLYIFLNGKHCLLSKGCGKRVKTKAQALYVSSTPSTPESHLGPVQDLTSHLFT